MTSPTDVCNTALMEGQTRTTINGFPPIDNTPAAVACSRFYTQKIQAMERAANWNFLRKQVLLTQIKAAVVNGAVSSDPPAQPFQYEYLYPADCLRARFLLQYSTPQPAGTALTTDPSTVLLYPYANTSVPFVIANDPDSSGNPRRVILTNMPNAYLIYTCDLAQYPDYWDSLFMTGAVALLAAYLIAALSGDKELLKLQVQIAQQALDQARAMNGNESMTKADVIPDYINIRSMGIGWGFNSGLTGTPYFGGWEQCQFPTGIFY